MKVVLPEDIEVKSDKTPQEIADIMGDDLKEELFIYVKETDRTVFIATVLGALTDGYDDRGEIFILVFEEGFSEEFADEVKLEVAELWKYVITKKHLDRPEDFVDPDNTIRKRWLQCQTGATDSYINEMKDFIIR